MGGYEPVLRTVIVVPLNGASIPYEIKNKHTEGKNFFLSGRIGAYRDQVEGFGVPEPPTNMRFPGR